MKKFDYIVIQAPMISELGLKGNSRLLFAMIHGFSKEGVNRYRASLKDMCDWLCTSKSAISPVLNALVEAGYINKHDVVDNGLSKPEYTTNYERLLAKAAAEGPLKPTLVYKEKDEKKVAKSARVLNPYPKQKAVNSMGTETVPGTESVRNGYGIKNEIGTESVPNKYNINIYKYYSCCYGELTEAQKQEEEKQFFKIFFFRGAADPAAEVKRFVGHNQANGWQNKSGVKYDSTEKRLGLADLWQFQMGIREDQEFLKIWKEVYERIADEEKDKILLNPRIKFTYTSDIMAINCPVEVAKIIETNIDKVRDIFLAHSAGKRICFKHIK